MSDLFGNGIGFLMTAEIRRQAHHSLVLSNFQLQSFSNCLSGTLTRDPDAPEKGQGEITMDDQIMKLRLTQQEKEDCTAVFQVVHI